MRRLLSQAVAFIWATATFAQQPCAVEIPVNVVLPNGGLVRRLNSEAFVVGGKGSPVPIASVLNETGPRRILLVVESGRRLPSVTKEVTRLFLSEILANARAQDSFALLTAKGPRVEVPFGAPLEELLAAVNDLKNPPKAKNQSDVDEVILEAIGWFKHPLPGDVIVLVTMGIDDERNSPHTKVSAALSENRIRLFGLQMGRFTDAYVTPQSGALGFPIRGWVYASNRGSLTHVAEESGGFAFYENTEGSAFEQYKFTDERRQEIGRLAGQLYKGVAEYYALKTEAPGSEIQIDLAESIRKELPKARLAYPRRVPDCSPM